VAHCSPCLNRIHPGVRHSAERSSTSGEALRQQGARQGHVVTAVTEQTSSGPYIFGNFPRYELVFVCTPEHEDPYDRLERLKHLLDSGVISQEEFDHEKRELLGP